MKLKTKSPEPVRITSPNDVNLRTSEREDKERKELIIALVAFLKESSNFD